MFINILILSPFVNPAETWLFRVECGCPGVGRGLRVEVEVLDDERTSTPAVVKDLGRCLTLPAAAPCRLIVVIGVICSSVWRAMSVARTPDALVLDVESCNQLAGCPGCGLNRSRPRARGRGDDRRALGRGPGKVPVV